MFKTLTLFLRTANLAYYHLSSLTEKLGINQVWAKELAIYFKTTPKKIIQTYQAKRQQTIPLWNKQKRNTIKKIHSFYQETDYFIYRQAFFHRHKIYLDVALTMLLKRKGKLCEYGGGIGPLTHWLIKLFPHWEYTIADLNCPVFKFAKFRYKNYPQVNFATVTSTKLPLTKSYDIILCKHVIEHVPEPLKVAKHLVKHLNKNGYLFIDYIYDPGEENLVKTAQDRDRVLKYLRTQLKPIFALNPKDHSDGYGLYQKKA